MTLEERVAQWPKQWFREGHERGLERGLEQGLANERALLVRMAATRFGPEIGERLAEVLAGIADPEGLAEVGERPVRSETGDELLSRVWVGPGKTERGPLPRPFSHGTSRKPLICRL